MSTRWKYLGRDSIARRSLLLRRLSYRPVFSFRYNGTSLSDFQDRTADLNSTGILGANSLSSFGEDNLGRLYVVDFGGQIYRLTGPAIPEPSSFYSLPADYTRSRCVEGWARPLENLELNAETQPILHFGRVHEPFSTRC